MLYPLLLLIKPVFEDAQTLCEKFNIETEKIAIGSLVDTYFTDKIPQSFALVTLVQECVCLYCMISLLEKML